MDASAAPIALKRRFDPRFFQNDKSHPRAEDGSCSFHSIV